MRFLVLLGATALLAGVLGCPTPTPTPPAEAVLAGTWSLVPEQELVPALENWTLSFDADGNLSQISYKFAGVAQVTLNDPPGATNVTGNDAFISATIQGSGFQFSGPFNSDKTRIDGTLSSNLVVGGATVTVDRGAASLTKTSPTAVPL